MMVAKIQYSPRLSGCTTPSTMQTTVQNQIPLTYPTGLPMSAWAEDDIPANKLLLKGTNAMSNSELLSVIIGNGIEGDNSLDIARRLLSHCDNNLCEL
jgi:hypothetical protein